MSLTKLCSVFCLIGLRLTTPIDAQELSSEELSALKAGKQGSVIQLRALWENQTKLPVVPVKITDANGPQFLFSDRPEYFYTGNGIALQEEVKPGTVRLYLYHVPEPTNTLKTISAVIENRSDEPMTLRFLRYAFPKPGKDYYRIGKTGLINFFNSKPEKEARVIPPRGRVPLDSALDRTTAGRDDLVHAFYEFEINQPARVTVFQRNPEQSSIKIIDELPKLSRNISSQSGNGAGRGLFLNSNLEVTNENEFILDGTNGPMRLIIADGERDSWIKGHDSLSEGKPSVNNGNYGVLYRIKIKRSSSDQRGLAVLMTKQGGPSQWCGGQAAAVQINEGAWPSGTVAIPTEKMFYGNPGEMVLIQKFPPLPKGETDTIELLYSPPGASCLPTPILFVPY